MSGAHAETGSRAVIEGYAALFGVPDLSGDVVRPGAFSKQDASAAKKLIPVPPHRVKMLHQHAAEAPVGRWTEIREDARGLFVRGEIFTDTGAGADLHRLLAGGALDGLSIGFKPVRAVRTKTGRELKEVDLWEVSIVTFPMAPGARITKVGRAQRPPRNLLSDS